MGKTADAQDEAVLRYVLAHPGCTARQVAVDVFGGSGATRTGSRNKASATLLRLWRAQRLRRCTADCPAGYELRYFPLDHQLGYTHELLLKLDD